MVSNATKGKGIININAKAIACVFAAILLSTNSHAQQRQPGDPWWFEAEVIFFKRNIERQNIKEQFAQQNEVDRSVETLSFLDSVLFPDIRQLRDGLEFCDKATAPLSLPLQTEAAPNLSSALLYGSIDDYIMERHTRPNFEDIESTQERIERIQQAQLFNIQSVVENKPSENLLSQLEQGIEQDPIIPESLAQQAVVKIAQHRPFSPIAALDFTPAFDHILTNVACQWQNEQDMFTDAKVREWSDRVNLSKTPRQIDGIEYPYSDVAYTLPKPDFKLTPIYSRMRRSRDFVPMLHVAWRQDVKTGRENAPYYHIIAGEKLRLPEVELKIATDNGDSEVAQTSEDIQHAQTGVSASDSISTSVLEQKFSLLLNTQSQDLDTLRQVVANEDSEPTDYKTEAWEIDGKLKLFIEYLGRTPYLHVDGQIDFHYLDTEFHAPLAISGNTDNANPQQIENLNTSPTGPQDSNVAAIPVTKIKTYHFDQIRRMISNEVHYFDHPAFGFVLQIRRYNRPEPPEEPAFLDAPTDDIESRPFDVGNE